MSVKNAFYKIVQTNLALFCTSATITILHLRVVKHVECKKDVLCALVA